jgi:hypothetical protein
MQNLTEQFTRADRDLIIRMDEKVDKLTFDVNELKNNIVERIACLEREKGDKAAIENSHADCKKHIEGLYKRISKLETWRYYIIGIFMALMTVGEYLFRVFNK